MMLGPFRGISTKCGSRLLHTTSLTRASLYLPAGLPAAEQLRRVSPSPAAIKDSPAPPDALRVAVFNLMPLKQQTELQLARMLSASDHAVEMTFVVPDGSKNKNTSPEHMASFYKKFSQVKGEKFDGAIVTGAPVEHMPFQDVSYWNEMEDMFEWIKRTDTSMYSICWGAMASLYHFHGVPKHVTSSKQFGAFPHKIERARCHRFPPNAKPNFVESLTGDVRIPVSRHTEWRMEDMKDLPAGVEVLVHSDETGPCTIWDGNLGHLHMMNHFEYAVDTLDGEYRRDLAKGTPTGEPIQPPKYYYPGDDPDKAPVHTWDANGKAFYGGWLDYVASKRVAKSKL